MHIIIVRTHVHMHISSWIRNLKLVQDPLLKTFHVAQRGWGLVKLNRNRSTTEMLTVVLVVYRRT